MEMFPFSPPTPCLLFKLEDGSEVVHELCDPTIIGRQDDCGIVVGYSSASARHAEIFSRYGRWFIRDLNSRNGTHVNGSQIEEEVLNDGDLIYIGEFECVFKSTCPAQEDVS